MKYVPNIQIKLSDLLTVQLPEDNRGIVFSAMSARQ
jgi:hypothetical protein